MGDSSSGEKAGGGNRRRGRLFLPERHAVGALVHGGVCFMGADHDFVQRAVVSLIAVVGTSMNSTFNALVCFAIHKDFLLL